MYKKVIMALIFVAILGCSMAPLASAANPYVWIAVKDSKGALYVNQDIYAYANYVPVTGLSLSAKYIGNTGKTGWLAWNGYIGAPFGYSYKFEARAKATGKKIGSMSIWLFPKQQNIVITAGKFVK